MNDYWWLQWFYISSCLNELGQFVALRIDHKYLVKKAHHF